MRTRPYRIGARVIAQRAQTMAERWVAALDELSDTLAQIDDPKADDVAQRIEGLRERIDEWMREGVSDDGERAGRAGTRDQDGAVARFRAEDARRHAGGLPAGRCP